MIMEASWSLEENQRCLMRNASVGYWLPGNVAGAFEIAEHAAPAGVDQRLDGGVGVLRRVMDLRNVEHGRHAVVELREAAEQFADVDILRPVDRRELVDRMFPK